MRALLGNTLYYMLLTSAVQAGGITMTSLVIGFLPFAVTIIGSRDRHAVPLSRLIPSLLFCAAGAVCVGWQAVMSSVSGGTSPLGLLCALVAQVGKDPLTGLQDRGQLNAKGPAMLAVASRSGLAVSLIMIDIDHFKYINDKYGHPLGDRVLCDVTAVITREKREGDELFRYGGEEFVLLCPETAPGRTDDSGARSCRRGKHAAPGS